MKLELKEVIYDELVKSQKARANDNYLTYRVFKRMGWSLNLKDIAQKDGVNRFVSIARLRRLIQQTNPALLPKKEVTKKRIAREKRFKEMVRGI